MRKVHGDGACDVVYDDGDDEEEVPLKFLRLPKKSKAAAPVKEQQPKAAAPVKGQQCDASDDPDETISKGRGKRKIVPTTCMVDGFAVKRQNMYDMEEGEGSVWDRELGEKDIAFAGQDRKEWDAPREPKAAKKGPRVASAAETDRLPRGEQLAWNDAGRETLTRTLRSLNRVTRNALCLDRAWHCVPFLTSG